MRRSDREVTDPGEVAAIVARCHVCRLAMNGGERPYLVPLNFGHEWRDGRLILYFHGALQGRKMDLLRQNPLVCFEMDRPLGPDPGATACRWGYGYESVIGSGRAELVRDPAQKEHALRLIMRQVAGPGDWVFLPEEVAGVAVFSVEAREYTAKRRALSGATPPG